MRGQTIWSTSVSWLFIASILLSSLQVTLAGFRADDDSWFSLIVNVMAEEESEDSETEESVRDAEWLTPLQIQFVFGKEFSLNTYASGNPYISFIGEVGSPPPEV